MERERNGERDGERKRVPTPNGSRHVLEASLMV